MNSTLSMDERTKGNVLVSSDKSAPQVPVLSTVWKNAVLRSVARRPVWGLLKSSTRRSLVIIPWPTYPPWHTRTWRLLARCSDRQSDVSAPALYHKRIHFPEYRVKSSVPPKLFECGSHPVIASRASSVAGEKK